MKILFFYGGSYVFGKERSALNLMEGLQDAGHSILNICNGWNDGLFIQLLNDRKIHYKTIKIGKISKSIVPKYLWWTLNAILHLPGALWKLKKQITAFNPEILVLESYYTLFFIRRLCNNRKVIVMHHEEPSLNYWFRQTAGYPAFHIGVSDFICQKLIEMGIGKDRVYRMYNAQRQTPTNTGNTFKSGNPLIIGYAGQVAEWKGVEDLIAALAIIKEKIKFHCLLAGTGDDAYITYIKEQCQHLGLENFITWLGYQKNMDRFYSKIHICVLPTRTNEPFGRTPLEAGLFGVPSIVTDRGGLMEIVLDGSTGLIVPSHAPEIIAEKIIECYRQPGMLLKMGEAAREDYSRRFSVDRQVKTFMQIIERAQPV